MSPWRFVLRSLQYHWRVNLSVALGVAAATAVLTGALLVGDSMRGSLRHLALDRLGRIDEVLATDQFFRAELADEVAAGEAFSEHFEAALPAILLRTTIENPENHRRAGRVSTLGCEPRFWELGSGGPAADQLPGDGEIVLNGPLAEELSEELSPIRIGDEVVLRVTRASQIPADSPLGRKTETIRSARLRISAIIPAEGLGRFSLRSNQQLPRNAFVQTKTLQSLLGQPGKANALLIAGRSNDVPPDQQAENILRRALRPTLSDYGLSLDHVVLQHQGEVILDYFNLTSGQMLLSPVVEKAVLAALAGDKPQPAFTYLANYITAGGGKAKIPYSTVTAIDSTARLGPLLTAEGESLLLGDGQIVLNSWAADDMAAQGVTLQENDEIQITFFEPESTHGQVQERTETFRLKRIVKLALPDGRPELTNDRHLTPEVPGLTDQASIDDWNPPFPYDSRRVRIRPPNDQDEQYWKQYRTTPKAFISLAAGRRLWRSRFGQTTSVRIARQEALDATEQQQRLTEKLETSIDPAQLGFVFQPVKRNSLLAAQGTTSFSGLFLGFSFFIIAAAVMLVTLLFRLGVQQRASQIGVLLAVGVRRGRTGSMLALEGGIVAALGGLLGVAAGVGYASLLLTGLRTLWLAAVVTPFLQLHVTMVSLLTGYAVGVVVSLLTIAWTLWLMRRNPVRQLLAGQADEGAQLPRRPRRPIAAIAVWVLLSLAAAAALAATQLSGEAEAGAFFGSGAAVLTAGLLGIWNRLRAGRAGAAIAKPRLALTGLAMRNAGRNPVRSTLTIGLVASASFLIVAISAFRLDPSEQGAGGFHLVAESDAPIFHDLNTAEGRQELGILPDEAQPLEDTSVIAFRVQAGDDASCQNLYQPRQPRVLGVPLAMAAFMDRFDKPQFAWAESAAQTPAEKANPWLLLDKPLDDGAIPVILDKNTAMYSMHLFVMKGTGTTFEIPDGRGHKIRLRIVGLLANSIFQGNLLISETQFKGLYPNISGYRFFLLKSAPGNTKQVLSLLEDKLSDQGFDVERTIKKLASLLAVQNTYLSTFQSLGALGLLLGTFGLATVQLRSVLERRGELALLRATGFRRSRLARLVMLESALLLAAGLSIGIAAALVAVLPHWLAGGASMPPLASLAAMLTAVLLAGLISGYAAVRVTLQAPLLTALLRGE